MSTHRLNQVDVAKTLGISASTLSRALTSNMLSSGVRDRILHHFPELKKGAGGKPVSADVHEDLQKLLHLLQETDILLEGIKSRVVSLVDVVQGEI